MAVLANYVVWGYASEVGRRDLRQASAKAYSGISIVESVTAAGLSGYFMFSYYWPRLRVIQGTKLFMKLWSSGFFYLVLEVLLHCCYTISFQISSIYYSAVTTVATALRFSLFLLFVYQIRHASKVTTTFSSETGSSSNKSSTHNNTNPNLSKHGDADPLPTYHNNNLHHNGSTSKSQNGLSMPLVALDSSQPLRGGQHSQSKSQNSSFSTGGYYHQDARTVQVHPPAQLPYQQVPEPQPTSPVQKHVAFGDLREQRGDVQGAFYTPGEGVYARGPRNLPPERDERYYDNL
ncbi:hypothetical protein HDU67_004068 [Dinochytrium kinnereticum]|nr:hypothetical protein HDU67_004068 [Dinochytrium kinnereticum]